MNPGVLCRANAELYALLADVDSIPVSDRLAPVRTLFRADTADRRACERVAAFIESHSEPARHS